MHPELRHRLIAASAGLAALVLGWQLASGQHTWAFLGLACFVVLLIEWLCPIRTEALLLGSVLFGYIIGNRGFAQISLVGNAPIFFGELALGAGMALVLIRGATQRKLPWEADWLNRAVLFWIGVGSIRILHDVRSYGAPALRDFATIYYAGFFFLAQAIMQQPSSARWLRRCMWAASALLPLVSVLYNAFPDFFLSKLVFRGVPLIYQKNDLVATFLFAGAFYLLSRERAGVWTRLANLASLGCGLAWLSRAALVALFAVTGCWSWARQYRPLKQLGIVMGLGLIGILAQSAIQQDEFTDTPVYAIYEHLASIGDISGTRVYRNAESADSGDNNRFRLVWWKTLTTDVWRENPWLGLGFGHDLAGGFIVNYGLWADENFNVRSPHSLVFTMLGRLGLVGILALLVLSAALVGTTHEVATLFRHKHLHSSKALAQDTLGWLSVAWFVFISALFGVVLEGPMGAVVFWTALGVANASRREVLSQLAKRTEEQAESREASRNPAEILATRDL